MKSERGLRCTSVSCVGNFLTQTILMLISLEKTLKNKTFVLLLRHHEENICGLALKDF